MRLINRNTDVPSWQTSSQVASFNLSHISMYKDLQVKQIDATNNPISFCLCLHSIGVNQRESVHVRTVVNAKRSKSLCPWDFSVGGGGGGSSYCVSPRLSLRVRVDAAFNSRPVFLETVGWHDVWEWTPPGVKCRMEHQGRGRCGSKCMCVKVGTGAGQWKEVNNPVHCLAISPFFRMICRCQGASLVSS